MGSTILWIFVSAAIAMPGALVGKSRFRTGGYRMVSIAMVIAVTMAGQVANQSTGGQDAATRAAAAAERSAAAAERAAAAAEIAANAAAKIAGVPPTTAAAAKAAAAAPSATWSGTAGLGLISVTGNAKALTFSVNATVERKSQEWIFTGKVNSAYGTAQPAGSNTSQVNALNAAGQLRADRRFNPMLSIFLLGGLETDHVQSVELRGYGEAGVALIWWDLKEADFSKGFFRTDLGFRYSRESRFQYYPTVQSLPGVTLIAPRFGAAFRYALNKGIIFTQDAEILPNVTGDSRVLVNGQSKLSTRLTDGVSLGVGFLVKYDSAPAPSRVSTDTSLIVGLEVAF